MSQNKKPYFAEKNLLKLKNGYVLEFVPSEQPSFGQSKIVFGSFFNEFNNNYILQIFRNSLSIRTDKD